MFSVTQFRCQSFVILGSNKLYLPVEVQIRGQQAHTYILKQIIGPTVVYSKANTIFFKSELFQMNLHKNTSELIGSIFQVVFRMIPSKTSAKNNPLFSMDHDVY